MTPTPDKQSIAWLRSQADRQGQIVAEALEKQKQYTAVADEMEAARKMAQLREESKPVIERRQSVNGTTASSPIATSQAILDYVAHKGGRAKHLAKFFGVSPEEITRLVKQPNSGVVIAERGWLKPADPTLDPAFR